MLNIEDKIAEAAISVGKETATDIVKPTAKSIGENIGLLVDGVMGWLGYWGKKQQIKRKVYLEDYKDKIINEIMFVPQENLIEPPIRIIGPAIEASKFFIEDETCRKMFSKLIGSACNSSLINYTHPSFIEIIKGLSPIEAKILLLFKKHRTYPAVELEERHSDGTITPFTQMLFDFKEYNKRFSIEEQFVLTKAIDNLLRFGLIKKNSDVIELNYNYEDFKSHPLYNIEKSTTKQNSKINMKKYRIELTEFGKDFVKCCISEENIAILDK